MLLISRFPYGRAGIALFAILVATGVACSPSPPGARSALQAPAAPAAVPAAAGAPPAESAKSVAANQDAALATTGAAGQPFDRMVIRTARLSLQVERVEDAL